jgi:hypothetical protein
MSTGDMQIDDALVEVVEYDDARSLQLRICATTNPLRSVPARHRQRPVARPRPARLTRPGARASRRYTSGDIYRPPASPPTACFSAVFVPDSLDIIGSYRLLNFLPLRP